MPEFRDINLNGLEIKSHPVEKWRRPFKNIIPYYLGNTARFEISVQRDTTNAPELWRVRLFENTPENAYRQMSEWHVYEGTNIIDQHLVNIERYLDELGAKRIMFQHDGIKKTIITIDVLSKEQIRWSLLLCALSIFGTFIVGISLGFIQITPAITMWIENAK